MKTIIFLLSFLCSFESIYAQDVRLPEAYIKDSFPELVKQCKEVLDKDTYMAQKLLAITDTLPGWEGFPVKLYEYKTAPDLHIHQPKTAKVYLLDPSPEKLAMWIATTCWIVKKSVDYAYTNKMLVWIKNQSGAQFPVKGLVYEDQYTPTDFYPYVFKDGVTVYVKDSVQFPKDEICTPEQINYYLQLTNSELKPQTGQYARIASTTREDYKNNGGKVDVGNKDDRKIEWLNVVRKLYQQAFRSDTNQLLIDWAKSHL
ncbi:MAG: cellulase [Chitinophagaceae bacterium]